MDVFLEGVGFVGYRADAALRIVCVALPDLAFRYHGNMPAGRGLEREREPRRPGPDDQKVGFHVGLRAL